MSSATAARDTLLLDEGVVLAPWTLGLGINVGCGRGRNWCHSRRSVEGWEAESTLAEVGKDVHGGGGLRIGKHVIQSGHVGSLTLVESSIPPRCPVVFALVHTFFEIPIPCHLVVRLAKSLRSLDSCGVIVFEDRGFYDSARGSRYYWVLGAHGDREGVFTSRTSCESLRSDECDLISAERSYVVREEQVLDVAGYVLTVVFIDQFNTL